MVLACVRLVEEDGGFWSTSAATSEAKHMQARRVHQNTGLQLLAKIWYLVVASDAGGVLLVCMRPAGGNDRFRSMSMATPRQSICRSAGPEGAAEHWDRLGRSWW